METFLNERLVIGMMALIRPCWYANPEAFPMCMPIYL